MKQKKNEEVSKKEMGLRKEIYESEQSKTRWLLLFSCEVLGVRSYQTFGWLKAKYPCIPQIRKKKRVEMGGLLVGGTGKSGPAGRVIRQEEAMQQNAAYGQRDKGGPKYIYENEEKKEEKKGKRLDKTLVIESVTHLLAREGRKKKVLARGDKRGGTEWIRRGNRNIKKTSGSDCMAGLLSFLFLFGVAVYIYFRVLYFVCLVKKN